jgi:hypothetical protein
MLPISTLVRGKFDGKLGSRTAARVQVEEDGYGRRISLIEGAERMSKLDEGMLARKRRRAKKI